MEKAEWRPNRIHVLFSAWRAGDTDRLSTHGADIRSGLPPESGSNRMRYDAGRSSQRACCRIDWTIIGLMPAIVIGRIRCRLSPFDGISL